VHVTKLTLIVGSKEVIEKIEEVRRLL